MIDLAAAAIHLMAKYVGTLPLLTSPSFLPQPRDVLRLKRSDHQLVGSPSSRLGL
jgi:hypothetical protein